MVPRIALLVSLAAVLAGFTAPKLPSGSRGVYRFDKVIATSSKTQDGAVFSLTLGFAKNAFPSSDTHRDRAQRILSRIEQGLAREDLTGVEITVARVYSMTREIALNVVVDDSARADEVRDRLVQALSKIAGVSFAGETGQVKVE